jgi:hypothetical protein
MRRNPSVGYKSVEGGCGDVGVVAVRFGWGKVSRCSFSCGSEGNIFKGVGIRMPEYQLFRRGVSFVDRYLLWLQGGGDGGRGYGDGIP